MIEECVNDELDYGNKHYLIEINETKVHNEEVDKTEVNDEEGSEST